MTKRVGKPKPWRPEFIIDLGFLVDDKPLPTRRMTMMFHAARADPELAKLLKRSRGQRTKLPGGQALERCAVALTKRRRDELKAQGIRPGVAWEDAKDEIARMLGVGPTTIQSWYDGVQRREREKPLDQRAFRRKRRD